MIIQSVPGASDQRQLWDLLVGDVDSDAPQLVLFGIAVGRGQLNASVHIQAGDDDLAGDGVLIAVVLQRRGGLC